MYSTLSDSGSLSVAYRRMVLIRAFEETLADLFERGRIGGTSHFCIGQEACAVGVIGAADERDYIVSNHRGHGHMLARGLEPKRVFGELMGRTIGYCRGRGGSQHISCMEKHFLGTNGITGGGLPIATGAAAALQYRNSNQCVIAFFGDGATNQGTFHESLNLSSVWKLPVLFVCENNLYGMSTSYDACTACTDAATRAAAYAVPGRSCDGMDVRQVFSAAADLLERVRNGHGPALLELKTYRFCGHSKNDERIYRTRCEERDWRQRDCLARTEGCLREAGVENSELQAIRDQTRESVRAMAQVALASPEMEKSEVLKGVYT